MRLCADAATTGAARASGVGGRRPRRRRMWCGEEEGKGLERDAMALESARSGVAGSILRKLLEGSS